MHVLLPLLLLALIFLLISCVGCTDRVLEVLHRVVHSRDEARKRDPPAPVH